MRTEEIRLQSKGDISKIMSPGTERKQSLKGFDDDYVDIVDYIVRCTHKIWEGHGIGLIYSHYAHNVSVWTTDGLTYGREAVIEGTFAHPGRLSRLPALRRRGDLDRQ